MGFFRRDRPAHEQLAEEGGIELPADPPYHAVARRGESSVWAAGAMEVAVVKVPEDAPGDEVALAVQGDERTLLVDDERSDADVPTLEEYGYAQHDAFVLRASRLDGLLWEVTVNAL